MMKILRRVIFFLFLAIFLIGAPKIVFYALGYSYHVGSEKGIVQTGLIYLSSAPPGASVYVEGRRYREPTPAIIRDLLPGNYPIRLVLKDYEVWSKTVPVEAAKASVLGKILLHPKKPEWRQRVAGPFESLTAIPETSYFLLKKSDDPGAIQIYDWKEKKAKPLFVTSAGKDGHVSDIYFTPGSTHVLFQADSGSSKEWGWMDLEQEESSKIIWGLEFPAQFSKPVWSDKDPRYLFSLDRGILSRFDIEAKALAPVADKLRGFGIDEKKLFMLTDEKHFLRTDFFNKNPKLVFQRSNPWQTLLGNKGTFEVSRLSDDIVFLLSDEGQLITNQRASALAEKGVRGFHFDKKHRKAVIWKEGTIGVVQFLKEKKEWGGFRPRVKVEWILKNARSLKQVFWAHDGSYLIFQDQNKVFLLELETFGSPSIHELLETKGESQVFYSDESGELFYLDKKTGNLMSLEVVPKWKVLEVPFSILQEKEKEGKAAA